MSDKRALLLKAGEELFADRGFGNTQIAEIARVAGTGISTFYRHFDDKEALLATLVAELFEPLAARLRVHRSGIEELRPIEIGVRVREHFAIAFDALLGRPRLTALIFTSGYGSSAGVTELVQSSIDQLASDLIRDLDRANHIGLLRVPNPSGFARAIAGVILHLGHANVTTGEPSRAAAIDIGTRMVLGGLITWAGPPTSPMVQAILTLLNEQLESSTTPES